MRAKAIQPPAAVRTYMHQNEETEAAAVSEYLRRQIQFYKEIGDKANSTVEQWIGFKLGCTAGQAKAAIAWASPK